MNQLIDRIKADKTLWNSFQNAFVERKISARTVLLNENEVADTIFFIKNGCLREAFNKDGKDISFQFFFEGQPVASMDSFIYGTPSQFSIESIEPSIVHCIAKSDFSNILQDFPDFERQLQDFIIHRFRNYTQLFLSHIKDSPQERYVNLLKNHPELVKRVPQHYIASYLGITPISLSRIRNRIKA